MASKDEIARLRAEVRARHRAATQKVSRLRQKGVEINNTNYDVRRDLNNVKRYTGAQLKSYLNQLDSFVARSNGFVPGDSGLPIPIKKWRSYKATERQYNRIGDREYNKVADTFLPNAGMKVRERRTILGKSATGDAVNSPYQEVNRSSRGITSLDALDKLNEQLKRKTSRDFLPGEIKRGRAEFTQMLVEIGNQQHIEAANKLSDEQFNILWNYTSFATEISRDYEIMKARARGEKERAHDKIHEDNTNAIDELLQWATYLPTKGGGKS